jgi:hypothetical protein
MASLINVYNQALRLIGEQRLTSTSEARDTRHHLDDAYTNVVARCLTYGYWNFALRSVQIASSDSLTPEFGFTYAFEKPTDWIRTFIISSSPHMNEWLLHVRDENGVWYSDIDPMWVKYVSNDASYGLDLAKWTPLFEDYVASELALDVCLSIGSLSDSKVKRLEDRVNWYRGNAESKDAMDEPPMFPPEGTWVRARGGGARPKTVNGGMIF